jgi:hypothetical protein
LEGIKRKRGQQPFVATNEQRKMVRMLAGLGTPHEGIRLMINGPRGEPISPLTLSKHFARELEEGRYEANAKVAKSLFKQATDGENVTAMIFWLKTRAGWREQQPDQPAATQQQTVMLVPYFQTKDEWESAARDAQEKLKQAVKE